MSADDEIRAGALILKDLDLFNRATVLFESKVDQTMRQAVTALAKRWLAEHNWTGETNVSEAFENLWVCPRSWAEKDAKQPLARFWFAYQKGIESCSFEIADMFGVGGNGSCFGFRFEPTYSLFGHKRGWAERVTELGEPAKKLEMAGWNDEGKGVFFRPVEFPAERLISSWEATDDWTEALEPLEQALDSLKVDQDHFNKILSKARSSGR